MVKSLLGDELFRSEVLRVNGEYIFVPQFYNDGYFFSVMYASQFRALQSDAVEDKSLLVSSLPESDLDGLVTHVLKIK